MTGGKQENDSGIQVMTPGIIVSSSVPRGCGLDCQVRKKTYGNWGKPTYKFIIIITFIFFLHGKTSGSYTDMVKYIIIYFEILKYYKLLN